MRSSLKVGLDSGLDNEMLGAVVLMIQSCSTCEVVTCDDSSCAHVVVFVLLLLCYSNVTLG